MYGEVKSKNIYLHMFVWLTVVCVSSPSFNVDKRWEISYSFVSLLNSKIFMLPSLFHLIVWIHFLLVIFETFQKEMVHQNFIYQKLLCIFITKIWFYKSCNVRQILGSIIVNVHIPVQGEELKLSPPLM